MPESRFTQYGAAAGAEQALRRMVVERYAKQLEAQKQAVEQQKLGQGARGLDLQSRGLDLREAAQNAPPPPRAPVSMSPGGSLVDPSSGRIIASIPANEPPPQRPISLSPGSRLVDPSSGRLITSVPDRPQSGGGMFGMGGTLSGPDVPAGVTGDTALEGQDEKTKNIVKMLADYKVQLPSGMALRTPEWQKYMGLARAYDPTFDATQYNTRQKIRSDFTSGMGARNIRSLNTAIAHLDTLQQKAAALNNVSMPGFGGTINRVKNFAAAESGSPQIVGFSNAATAVENELANVFKGTGATDQEVKQWRASLNASQSPQQFKESINTAIELMKGRIGALQDQYTRGMGKPLDFQLISPGSQKILDRLQGSAPSAQEPATTSGVSITAIRQVR